MTSLVQSTYDRFVDVRLVAISRQRRIMLQGTTGVQSSNKDQHRSAARLTRWRPEHGPEPDWRCRQPLSGRTTGAPKLIERSHEHIVQTIPDDEVCGIPVITTIDTIDNIKVRLAKNGFPLFKSTGRGRLTFTNPATGKSVVQTFSGATKDLSVVDNGDGTITLRTAVTGVPEEVTLSDGTVAIKDVGRIVFVTVIDYNGTPTDVEDDEFLSQTIESISGPHPDAESGFTLFCEVVVPALT